MGKKMSAVSKDESMPTPIDLFNTTTKLTRTGLELWLKNIARPREPGDDPLRLSEASMALMASLMRDPLSLARIQTGMLADYVTVLSRLLSAAESPPPVVPERGDRRFRDEAWDDNPVFDLIKQTYLIAGRGIMEVVNQAEGLDEETRQRLEFATQQIVDALAPSNFALTNPVVLRTAVDTGGRNLLDGLNNLLDDLAATGRIEAPMAEVTHFEVGEDLAVTPGAVVFQNEMMQLIQYDATTEKVNRCPLLLPPWMNKFYVMDLRPGNSFIQWLVDQGHTVFVVSWVNPGPEFAHKGFEDYMMQGPLAALDAIEKATGQSEVNVVGYCLGGILLAASLAWMAAKSDARVRSATLLTTMVDFSDTGEVSLFIDEQGLDSLERKIWEQGFLDGRSVYDTFRALRANDLVWSFYVNSYLMGNKPAAFDLLYWNSDATNMPAAMHTFFMRNMYLKNRLREPGGIEIKGVPIDVRKVRTPTYILSTVEDHIAPWKTTYETTQLFGGPVKFVLGESGHIAGVINPPAKKKYGYWTNAENPDSAEGWLDDARHHAGSWWPDWGRWMSRHGGGKVAARKPGDGELEPIEAAPGSYVLKRNARA
jgi:polyhydroxyalkanoate synthase